MPRITNAILAEKIDTLTNTMGEIKTDVKSNSEFRIQFKGFITGITMFSGLLGGLIAFGLSKIWPK